MVAACDILDLANRVVMACVWLTDWTDQWHRLKVVFCFSQHLTSFLVQQRWFGRENGFRVVVMVFTKKDEYPFVVNNWMFDEWSRIFPLQRDIAEYGLIYFRCGFPYFSVWLIHSNQISQRAGSERSERAMCIQVLCIRGEFILFCRFLNGWYPFVTIEHHFALLPSSPCTKNWNMWAFIMSSDGLLL